MGHNILPKELAKAIIELATYITDAANGQARDTFNGMGESSVMTPDKAWVINDSGAVKERVANAIKIAKSHRADELEENGVSAGDQYGSLLHKVSGLYFETMEGYAQTALNLAGSVFDNGMKVETIIERLVTSMKIAGERAVESNIQQFPQIA